MTAPDPKNVSKSVPKLGLALSGGGFRATIFHIGVLRRLADLDLLKEVSVISTASGGSITGAHYLLHLKHRMENNGQALTKEDYQTIVTDMEQECRHGVAQNPRSRLFLNPVWNLKIFCCADPPGERMASLYQRFFYGGVTKKIGVRAPWRRPGILLHKMLITPTAVLDIDRHNVRPGEQAGTPAQRIPKLIINASSLNSGAAFRFMATEVGDARHGFIRKDEAVLIQDCKRMLGGARSGKGMTVAFGEFERAPATADDATGRRAVIGQGIPCVIWFLDSETSIKREKKKPVRTAERVAAARPHVTWDGKQEIVEFVAEHKTLSRKLMEAPFGILRRAKVAAWYLVDDKWKNIEVRGGHSKAGHHKRFREAIVDIDKQVARRFGINPNIDDDERPDVPAKLLEFILCLYYLRSARAFAWDVEQGFDRLRLVDAVASSANFPPVFTPYHVHDLYDASTVKFLSLTDGGVHDNTGMQALLDDECTDIIASDVSGLFRESKSPAGDRVNMMGRIGGLLTAHVRNMQLDDLHTRVDIGKHVAKLPAPPKELEHYCLRSSAFFHMLSSPSDARVEKEIPPHPYADLIANVRTDLDVFGRIEIDALIYQGYQLADRFVRAHLRKDFVWKYAEPTIPAADATTYAGNVLKAASRRFGRVAAIYKNPFIVLGIVLAIAILMIIRNNPVSVAGLIDGVGDGIGSVVAWGNGKVRAIAPGVWDCIAWREKAFLRWIILGRGPLEVSTAGAVVFVLFSSRVDAAFGRFLSRRSGGRAGIQVWRLKIARILAPWRRSVTWLMWLFPLWLALLGFLVFGTLMAMGLLTRFVTSRRTG